MIGLAPFAQAAESDFKLWYDKPAGEWIEALPIGNGRLTQARVISTGGTHGRLRLGGKETAFSVPVGGGVVVPPGNAEP